MSAQQENIYNLLTKLEAELDKGFPLLSSYMVVVKRDAVETLMDNIYASLPVEVQEARNLLRRRDEIQHEAQQRAEQLIRDAQAEAARLVSKSDLLQQIQREAQKYQEQIIAECEALKKQSVEEAEAIRSQAKEEVIKTKEGASVFAEQILTNLEQNINQLQQLVKSVQVQFERQRTDMADKTEIRPQVQSEQPVNFKID